MIYNVTNLCNHMIKIMGVNIISSSYSNPNKKDEILIDLSTLLNNFTDNKIHNYASTNWSGQKTISIDKFIDFLVNHVNGNETQFLNALDQGFIA